MRTSFRTILFVAVVAISLAVLFVLNSLRTTKEPVYLGHPLSEWLQNQTIEMTDRLTLNQLLTLKQVITGEEPGIATFTVPINYDSLKKDVGTLMLLVDGKNDEYSGKGAYQECDKATNGDCLLAWNTTFDPPGNHTVQALLFVDRKLRKEDGFKILGPAFEFCSSNVVQFDPFYSEIAANGTTLHARIFWTNVAYSIELRAPTGQHIKTISGVTTNGVLDQFWNLNDEDGRRWTNIDEVKAIFHVTNSISGAFSTQELDLFLPH